MNNKRADTHSQCSNTWLKIVASGTCNHSVAALVLSLRRRRVDWLGGRDAKDISTVVTLAGCLKNLKSTKYDQGSGNQPARGVCSAIACLGFSSQSFEHRGHENGFRVQGVKQFFFFFFFFFFFLILISQYNTKVLCYLKPRSHGHKLECGRGVEAAHMFLSKWYACICGPFICYGKPLKVHRVLGSMFLASCTLRRGGKFVF